MIVESCKLSPLKPELEYLKQIAKVAYEERYVRRKREQNREAIRSRLDLHVAITRDIENVILQEIRVIDLTDVQHDTTIFELHVNLPGHQTMVALFKKSTAWKRSSFGMSSPDDAIEPDKPAMWRVELNGLEMCVFALASALYLASLTGSDTNLRPPF